MKRNVPVLTLALLSPFVAEILFGATPLSRLASLPPLILLYGGGAVLIRELARRISSGWDRVAWLAAACGFRGMAISVPNCCRSRFRSDADQCSELKPISLTVVARNGDRHQIGTTAQASRGDWTPLVVENPVAPEEADHAQVEGSSAAPFARTEPASDRPQLWHFPEQRTSQS